MFALTDAAQLAVTCVPEKVMLTLVVGRGATWTSTVVPDEVAALELAYAFIDVTVAYNKSHLEEYLWRYL